MTTINTPRSSALSFSCAANKPLKNIKFELLKHVNQSNLTLRTPYNKTRVQTTPLKKLSSVSIDGIQENLKNVRNNSNRYEAESVNVNSNQCLSDGALACNDFFNSLDNSFVFVKNSKEDAINFWKKEMESKDIDVFFCSLSSSSCDVDAVDKIKNVLLMTKWLYESYSDNDALKRDNIKKDIKFLADYVKTYGLGMDSPVSGSSRAGFKVLNKFDHRINKVSNEAFAKGLDYNAVIDSMVKNKIETVQDKKLRDFLHQEWKGEPFRESIRVFDKIDGLIKECNGFHRADALLSHQPIKLDLFKDYIKSVTPPKNNNIGNKESEKSDAGNSKNMPGPTYIFNDYSTNINDNSTNINDSSTNINNNGTNINDHSTIFMGDGIRFYYNENYSININTRQSYHDTSRGDDHNVSSGRGAATSAEDSINNNNKFTRSVLTRPEKVVEQVGPNPINNIELNHATAHEIHADHTDVSALYGKDISILNINSEREIRSSIQQVTPLILNNIDSKVVESRRPYIGSHSTGRTGAVQYMQYWQPASNASDNGILNRENGPLTELPNNILPEIIRDGVHSHGEKLSAPGHHTTTEKNNVPDNSLDQALTAASFTRQRGQAAAVLNSPMSYATMMQSSELRMHESIKPLSTASAAQNTQNGASHDSQRLVKDLSTPATEENSKDKTNVATEAKHHYVEPSPVKNVVTSSGYAPYKGSHWGGLQGAAIKQSYLNSDKSTKIKHHK